MIHLVRTQPTLRTRAAYQAALFCAFNMFWTASPLLLAKQFGFDQRAIALFALAGAGGAIAAPFAGWLADRGFGGRATLGAFVTIVLAFAASAGAIAVATVVGFAIAGIAIDAAVQTNQVCGQRIIFALSREARGRINAIYLTSIFLFGSTGPAIGSWLYETGGWDRVAFAGGAIGIVLCASWMFDFMRKTSRIA